MAKRKQNLGPWQRAWVESLESGEWRQGRHRLCQIDDDDWRHCCLGVACEVATQNGIDIECRQNGLSVSFGEDLTTLPSNIAKLMKFHSCNGELRHTPSSRPEMPYNALSQANDQGVSFERIAAFARKFPEAIFSKDA